MGGRGSSSYSSRQSEDVKKISTVSYKSWTHPTTGEERIYINGDTVDYARSIGFLGKKEDYSNIQDKKYKKKLEQEQKYAESEFTIGKYEKTYIINEGGFARVKTKGEGMKLKGISSKTYGLQRDYDLDIESSIEKGGRILELSAKRAGFKRYKQGYKFSDIKKLVQ